MLIWPLLLQNNFTGIQTLSKFIISLMLLPAVDLVKLLFKFLNDFDKLRCFLLPRLKYKLLNFCFLVYLMLPIINEYFIK